jgi:hypothetical protein
MSGLMMEERIQKISSSIAEANFQHRIQLTREQIQNLSAKQYLEICLVILNTYLFLYGIIMLMPMNRYNMY